MFKFIYKYRFYLITGLILSSILLLFINSVPIAPIIIASSIKDKQTNVLLNTPLTLTFSAPLSPKERRRLTFTLTPQLQNTPSWDKASTVVRLITTSLFTKNTHYSLDVLYQNKSIYTLSFVTNPYDEADLAEQAKKQAADDLIFGQKATERIQKYPWSTKLPIITSDYYIFYSYVDSIFKLYITSTSANQKEIEQQAVDALKKIGVPTQDLKYTVVN